MIAIQPHNILTSNSVVLVASFRSLHFTRQQFWKAHPLGVKVREDFHAEDSGLVFGRFALEPNGPIWTCFKPYVTP